MTYDSPPEISLPEPHPSTALPGKRLFDVMGATVILLAVLPVMAAVALVVLLIDGRPILFRQVRVGRRGRLFTILKFRTMVSGAEQMVDGLKAHNERRGPLFKLTHDPRVTRIGRFLRDSSLDELPQLLNVLLGDMSLVGPRPTSFAPETYAVWHGQRLEATPGITGLWQVQGRNTTTFDERLRLDVKYIREMSLRLDLKIMLLTVGALVRRSGA